MSALKRKFHLICTVEECLKYVERLLIRGDKMVAVATKRSPTNGLGKLVLVQIGSLDGHIHVFDIKTCPQMMCEGGLWRILLAEEITKVMHDCRWTSAALRNQFDIVLRNVFDTQAAYCALMKQEGMQPRIIDTRYMFEKFGNVRCPCPGDDVDRVFEPLVSFMRCCTVRHADHMCWGLRPVDREMVLCAATDILCLIPNVYRNIKKHLAPESISFVDWLTRGYIDGALPPHDDENDFPANFQLMTCNIPLPEEDADFSALRARNTSLNDGRRHLLEKTVPRGATQTSKECGGQRVLNKTSATTQSGCIPVKCGCDKINPRRIKCTWLVEE